MKSGVTFLVVAPLAILILSCSPKKDHTPAESQRPSVIIAIEGDIDSFDPLFAEDVTAGEINDLIYPSLAGSDFDTATGELKYVPLLARSWGSADQGRDLVFHLLNNVRWSDGEPVTARDVQLSYELYGDPAVASIRQGAVEKLRPTNGKPDVAKSVEVVNDSTVVFHFAEAYPGQLFDAGLPILPAHVFSGIPRDVLRTHSVNKNPIGCGPFALGSWTALQETVLRPNAGSVVPSPAKVPQLVFRVIPDYRSRLSQLEAGEVDLVSDVRPEDADKLARESGNIQIISTAGRDYDFLGWNNIDPEVYVRSHGSTIRPHKLFGSTSVRTALTMAINREELAQAYLGKHGQVAFGGISPLFKWAYNDTLKPLPFDPVRAKAILEKEGWKDSDGDGVLDREGVRFSFILKYPAGNQLRTVVATAVQQQLKNVGVEMKIEQVERGTFWQEVATRKYDAWLAGFSVPLQMQLDDLWGSDLGKYAFNLAGFRNKRIDQILSAARHLRSETDGATLWHEFQTIIHEQQPCTFLYWINSIVAVNKRVHGTRIGVLGITHHAWEWTVDDAGAATRAPSPQGG